MSLLIINSEFPDVRTIFCLDEDEYSNNNKNNYKKKIRIFC